jgi:hypothetical protein
MQAPVAGHKVFDEQLTAPGVAVELGAGRLSRDVTIYCVVILGNGSLKIASLLTQGDDVVLDVVLDVKPRLRVPAWLQVWMMGVALGQADAHVLQPCNGVPAESLGKDEHLPTDMH